MSGTAINTAIWTPYAVLFVLGFLAGLLRPKVPWAATAVSAIVIIGYLTVIAITGVWAASCTECGAWRDYDMTRAVDIYLAIFWGGILGGGILLVTWVTAAASMRVSRALGRRRQV
jgi:hypothetical protein